MGEGDRLSELYLGNVFRQRATALATHLAYRGRLLNLFGLDGEAGLVPSLEAPFQSDGKKSLVSQHQRRPGAGFLVESSAVGDDRGRPGQLLGSVSEFFGSDADGTCDCLMHQRIDTRGDDIKEERLASFNHGLGLFGRDPQLGVGGAQRRGRTITNEGQGVRTLRVSGAAIGLTKRATRQRNS